MFSRRPGARALAITLLFSLSTAQAADKDKKPGKDRRPDHFHGMTSELLLELDQKIGLSDEQKEKIVALKQDFQDKHKDELCSLRERVMQVNRALEQTRKAKDASGQRKAREQARELQQAAEKLRVEFEQDLVNVLDESQRMQYEALKKELAKPGRFRPGKKPPPKKSSSRQDNTRSMPTPLPRRG